MRNNDYTHGGSAGKNLILLFRALANIVAFAAMWYGTATLESGVVSVICAFGGAALSAVLIYLNLISPFIHRAK